MFQLKSDLSASPFNGHGCCSKSSSIKVTERRSRTSRSPSSVTGLRLASALPSLASWTSSWSHYSQQSLTSPQSLALWLTTPRQTPKSGLTRLRLRRKRGSICLAMASSPSPSKKRQSTLQARNQAASCSTDSDAISRSQALLSSTCKLKSKLAEISAWFLIDHFQWHTF